MGAGPHAETFTVAAPEEVRAIATVTCATTVLIGPARRGTMP